MLSRHQIIGLRQPIGAYALISSAHKKNTAVIFVHGFSGSPITTWLYFQSYIDDFVTEATCQWWQKADLYFYAYSTATLSIPEHGTALLDFINSLYPKPNSSVFQKTSTAVCNAIKSKLGPLTKFDDPLAGSSMPKGYDDLVLVGHSLGAVILRQAILMRALKHERADRLRQRIDRPQFKILNGRLRLFAPAILGANPSGALGLFTSLFLGVAGLRGWLQPIFESNTVVRQIKAESRKLEKMQRDTERLANRYPHSALIAHILFGARENLVERDAYGNDELELSEPGHDHYSICKPTQTYRKPLSFVIHGKKSTPKAVTA
jgi:hypothetical protein